MEESIKNDHDAEVIFTLNDVTGTNNIFQKSVNQYDHDTRIRLAWKVVSIIALVVIVFIFLSKHINKNKDIQSPIIVLLKIGIVIVSLFILCIFTGTI